MSAGGRGNRSWQARLQEQLARVAAEVCKKYDIKLEHLVSYRGWAELRGQQRVVICPRLRGCVSFAYFAHEVGHHVLDHDLGRTSAADEEAAWGFARALFDEYGIKWTPLVSATARDSLAGALQTQGRATSGKLRAIKHLENSRL